MFEKDITEIANDSRLCEPSDGKKYKWRKLIEEVKKKGEPLTEKEASKFIII